MRRYNARTRLYIQYYKPEISKAKRRRHYACKSKGIGYKLMQHDRQRYTSKAYRLYIAYIHAECFGYSLGELLASQLMETANRPGFTRLMLEKQNGVTKDYRTKARILYDSLYKDYDRHKNYTLTLEQLIMYKQKQKHALLLN